MGVVSSGKLVLQLEPWLDIQVKVRLQHTCFIKVGVVLKACFTARAKARHTSDAEVYRV